MVLFNHLFLVDHHPFLLFGSPLNHDFIFWFLGFFYDPSFSSSFFFGPIPLINSLSLPSLVNIFFFFHPSFLINFFHLDFPNLFFTYWLIGFFDHHLSFFHFHLNSTPFSSLKFIFLEFHLLSFQFFPFFLLNSFFKGKIFSSQILIPFTFHTFHTFHPFFLIVKFSFGFKKFKIFINYLDKFPFFSFSKFLTFFQFRKFSRFFQRKSLRLNSSVVEHKTENLCVNGSIPFSNKESNLIGKMLISKVIF